MSATEIILNDYLTFYKCIKYKDQQKIFIIKNRKGQYRIIEITPHTQDINSIESDELKSNYLIKIIDPTDNEYEMTKIFKNYYHILMYETPYLYNNIIKEVNIKKANNNKYIDLYRDSLNLIRSSIVDKTGITPYTNLFNYYDKQKHNNLQTEIHYYLKTDDKKKRIFFNILGDYYILILPNMLGPYNQKYEYFYKNTTIDEYEFNEITSLLEDHTNSRLYPKRLFNIQDKEKMDDLHNILKFTLGKYLFNSYKGQNINYQCLIIPIDKDNKNILHGPRDLNQIHLDLLKYIYKISNIFVNDLHDCVSDELRIYTRIYTDVYGILYFKIESMNPFNYHVVKEGSHDKELDITLLIHNIQTYNNYYQECTFEYNLAYTQYNRDYKKFQKYYDMISEKDNFEKENRNNMEKQVRLLETLDIKPIKEIDHCQHPKKYVLKKHNNCQNKCCDVSVNQIYTGDKKYKIIRMLDEKLLNKYTFLCRCDNEFYVITLIPTNVDKPYDKFINSLDNPILLFDNITFHLYTATVKKTRWAPEYINIYSVESIIHINNSDQIKNNSYLREMFYTPDKILTRVYETKHIRNQIKYHLNNNMLNFDNNSWAIQILDVWQKIYLGIDDFLIGINDTEKYLLFDYFFLIQ